MASEGRPGCDDSYPTGLKRQKTSGEMPVMKQCENTDTVDMVPPQVNGAEAIQDGNNEDMDMENQTEEAAAQSDESAEMLEKRAILSDIHRYVSELLDEKKDNMDLETRKAQLELNILMSKKKREAELHEITRVHLEQEKVKLTQEEMKLKQEVLKAKLLEIQLVALRKS